MEGNTEMKKISKILVAFLCLTILSGVTTAASHMEQNWRGIYGFTG